MPSNYEAVKQFTEESSGIECPSKPTPMNRGEVVFLLKMVLSEMTELAQTVTDSSEEAIKLMHECIGADPSVHPSNDSEIQIIANQGDAMVDAWYYMCNAAAKKGIDVSRIFDVVHEANMAKKDPETGKFIKRDDGKILKPADWKPADIEEEIRRQME